MKLSRLSGRKNCDFLRRKGNVFRGKAMTIRWLPRAPKDKTDPGVYVGTSASAKLHKSAVKRNRMRRRCREALRTAVLARTKLPTVQLLITPKSSSLDCDYSDICSDISNFLAIIEKGSRRLRGPK